MKDKDQPDNLIMTILDSVKWFGLRKLYWQFRRFINGNHLTVDDVSQKLIAIYDGYMGHNASYNKAFIGLGLIHYSIIRNARPKNILCIGSRKGFIPATMAMACKENKYGKVDFVDAGYGDESPEKNWTGIGFWKKEDLNSHFGKIEVNNYINSFIMTTKEFAKKFPKKKFDYIYIDGDHSYKGVKSDYKLFWPRLNKKGFMTFHDISVTGTQPEGEYGVKRFWNEIRAKNRLEFSFVGSGLGIIQKI